MIIIKRKPHLTLYLSVCSIIAISVFSPMYLYFAMDMNDFITKRIFMYTIPVLYGLCTYCFIYIFVLRFWMIFFDVKWAQASTNAQWKKIIDENEEKCWFLTHKSTYGNTKYCSKLILIPFIITCIPIIYIDITNDANLLWTVCNGVAMIPPLLFVTILWNKTPKINDQFRIMREAKLFCRGALCTLLLYLLMGFTPILGATQFTRYILGNIVGVLSYGLATLFYTCYPLYIALVHEHEQMMNQLSSVATSGNKKPELTQTGGISNNRRHHSATLSKVLSEEESFLMFMEHLRHEWSMELLLSFIEFAQYKKLVMEMFTNEIDQNLLDQYWKSESRQHVILDNSYIPYSSIVHEGLKKIGKPLDLENLRAKSCSEDGGDHVEVEMSSTVTITNLSSENVVTDGTETTQSECGEKLTGDFHDKALKLCTKYVANGSEFQINLPDKVRTRLMTQINEYLYNNEKMCCNGLFVLFDDAIEEMWKLMGYSFCRFILTEKFQSLNMSE